MFDTNTPRDAAGRFASRRPVASFTQFIDAAIVDVKASAAASIQQATFELFTRIVQRTPVLDGQAAGNWNFSIGEPSFQVTPNAKAERGYAEAAKALSAPMGSIVYFTNVLPYIRVLEYGLYPNPPIRGTYIPSYAVIHGIPGPRWYKFSQGGFSKIAPQGMVRISVAEFNLRTQQ